MKWWRHLTSIPLEPGTQTDNNGLVIGFRWTVNWEALMKRIAKLFGAIVALVFVVNLLFAFVPMVFAQDATPPAEPVSIWKAVLDMAMKSLVPALWVALGPLAVAGITKGINKVSTAYVPRPIQMILAALVGAVGTGLTGDPSLVATSVTGQVLAATKPETLLTSARPE